MDRTALDYPVLVATLQAWQLSSETARAESRCAAPRSGREARDPAALTRILLGGQGWQQAVLDQGGSFNRLFAGFAQGA